ncbi:biotin/lipoyl-binding protein [Bacillus sp. MUM 13]|uniref:efflux RND transporter periplasmic adaptor subunit n=1 Tax=Bacillus sp. MUM 13 TaxID=1678001 RepID=UPI0008F5D44D|nr:biotin/lipoyl-binding protein [Bacillus sp. MUM 13]OIK09973.1 hypothetical protein BIV59_15460 [Bacillus sp. MUM 13]
MKTVGEVKSKKKWITLCIIIILVIFITVNVLTVRNKRQIQIPKNIEYIKVTDRVISNTRLIAGQITSGNRSPIYLDSSKGKISKIYVKEGEKVKKGQRIFTYDNKDIDIQIRQADIDTQITQSTYNNILNKIDSLNKQIKKIKKEQGKDSASLQSLKDQLRDQENQKNTTELEIEKNRLQVENLQDKESQLTVFSEKSGVVTDLNKDMISSSNPTNNSSSSGYQPALIMNITSKSPYQIQGILTELQKEQIKTNQSIKVTAKASPNKTWNGHIKKIDNYPTQTNLPQTSGNLQQTANISYYNFEATLESGKGLSPGYHVDIQVNLSSKSSLVVPNSSIENIEDSPYVFMEINGKIAKQSISIGMSDNQWTQVTKGLKLGDKVVEDPDNSIQPGMEVKK